MTKIITRILFLLCIFYSFISKNHTSNNAFTKEKQVIYYSELLDSIRIYDYGYCTIELLTRRDISQFQNILNKNFGNPVEIEHVLVNDSTFGKFRWQSADIAGWEDLEIMIDIFPGNQYTISICVFNKEKINITSDPEIQNYFRKLITENVLTQPIKITEIGRTMPLSINLNKIMSINEDSLQLVYDKYFSFDTVQIEAQIEVDKTGKILKTEIVAPYKLIPEVENFISNLNMPIIIYQEAGDTAIYEVVWNFTCSEKHIIELVTEKVQYELSEKRWAGMDTTNVDFIGNIALKYRYGNFFEKDKIHCIINIPEFSSLYVYLYSENMFIEKAHIRTVPYYDYFYLEDVTFDNNPEIITTSGPNMNGNYYVFAYSYKSEELNKVGHWAYGETTLNREKKEIYEVHGGSWYTPFTKTVYGLINNRYIRKRQIEIRLKEEYMDCKDYILYYRENPSFESGTDTLILKMNVLYDENNISQQELWNDFFDNNKN